MIESLYDVSVSLTGILPTEMQFINAIITLCLASIILIVFIAPFYIIYLLASRKKRW